MSGIDPVTRMKLLAASPETMQFLSDVAAAEVERLGGDDPAMLFVAGTLYEIAVKLDMAAMQVDRADAIGALHALGQMPLGKTA